MNVDFGEILTTAWKIVWKHKVLWIFGIFAGCTANGASGSNSNYSFSSSSPSGNLPPGVQDFFDRLAQNPGQVAGIIAAIFAVACLVSLLLLALSVLGRIGLITGTHKADGGAARLTFRELVAGSRPYFWRVFGLNILLGLAAFVLALLFIVVAVVFAAATLGLGLFCLIPIICLLIPVAWLAAVLVEQANIAIVLEDLSIPDGISRGWKVINANWGTMIIMALILLIGSGFVSLILALPFFVVAFPAAFAFIAAGPDLQNGLFALGLVCACLYLPVLILANGLIQTYYHSAWTLTFLRATGRKPLLPEGPVGPPAPQPQNA
jgi:hypothetical protein